MMVKTVVWIPFGDLMHEDKPGPRFASTQGNPDWWEHRARILKEFTLHSLARQTFRDFSVVAGLSEECGDKAAPVEWIMKGAGHSVYRHPLTDPMKRGQTPAPGFVEAQMGEADALRVIWLDSDDMYAPDALRDFAAQPVKPDAVYAFKAGHIADTAFERVHIYNPNSTYPPFFCRIYTRDCLKDVNAYEKRHGFWHSHYEVNKAPAFKCIGDNGYCIIVHGKNMSTFWTNNRLGNKLRERLAPDAARAVKERFIG